MNFRLNARSSLFPDAKEALLRPVATGRFHGAPVAGHPRLDPWALTAGRTFRL